MSSSLWFAFTQFCKMSTSKSQDCCSCPKVSNLQFQATLCHPVPGPKNRFLRYGIPRDSNTFSENIELLAYAFVAPFL